MLLGLCSSQRCPAHSAQLPNTNIGTATTAHSIQLAPPICEAQYQITPPVKSSVKARCISPRYQPGVAARYSSRKAFERATISCSRFMEVPLLVHSRPRNLLLNDGSFSSASRLPSSTVRPFSRT